MAVKIDGRKAEITRSGQRWTSFNALADALGYPDAAVAYNKDRRKCPENGDIVTVLSSKGANGKPVIHEGNAVYIVEAANGERHIFSEKGLRILSKVNEAITLLPDESLGGLMREYNEVKRKARVGELVKSTVDKPPVFTVTEVTGGQGAVYGGADGVPTHAENYRVLEPSDIIRINSERFRMVERKAAVGERVIALKPCDIDEANYRAGCTFVVEDVDYFGADITDLLEEGNAIPHEDYRVLEPLTAAIQPQNPQLSTLDPVDQYAENIAKLTTKVQALEERVATLEKSANTAKVASGSVNDALPSFVTKPKKTDQQLRDEIVARAKADVVRLSNMPISLVKNNTHRIGFWPHGSEDYNYLPIDFVEFSANCNKRTVVAMIRSDEQGVWLRGIAKAAPGEVFNVHIGKAIALHRALGLEVPAEYMNVPAPTDVRAGDIVRLPFKGFTREVAEVTPLHIYYKNGGCNSRNIPVIIDDSREESEGVNA